MMALLEIENLTKEFGGLTAVDEVNLSFDEGELVSIIGPNGAGKSTVINLITGLLAPTSGNIRFQGEDIVEKEPHEISQMGIGRSFQTASIFPELSVRDNVSVAAFASEQGSFTVNFFRRRDSYDEVIERTDHILETMELENEAETEAQSLPYGDKRRLEVAVGLATDPTFMFMDEPTAGMSPEATEMTVELIRDLLSEWGLTICLVEHDMSVVFEVSDRIVALHQGQVISKGTPDEMKDDPDVREAYLGGADI